jgi:hypothetical protein
MKNQNYLPQSKVSSDGIGLKMSTGYVNPLVAIPKHRTKVRTDMIVFILIPLIS